MTSLPDEIEDLPQKELARLFMDTDFIDLRDPGISGVMVT
jgi:hypothetical protein